MFNKSLSLWGVAGIIAEDEYLDQPDSAGLDVSVRKQNIVLEAV